MPSHLNLDQLRTFVAAVDETSFGRAAERLGLAAPTVSLQMKRLEEQLGAELFYQDGRGKGLTDTGRRFLTHARKILQLNDLAVEECRETAIGGRIRIGTTQDFAEERLLFVLREFGRLHPKVQIELTVDLNRKIHAALERGDVDLAVAAVDPLQAMSGDVLCREPLVWIASEDFRYDPNQPMPLVLFHPPCIVRDITLQTLNEAERGWRISCTSPSLSGLLAATKANFGVTVRTRDHIENGLRELKEQGLPALPELSIALFAGSAEGAEPKLLTRMSAMLRSTLFGWPKSGARNTLAAAAFS